MGILGLTLTFLAASDVRISGVYFALYFVIGLTWVSGMTMAMKWVDWNFGEDVLERNNWAAALGQGGLVLGLMLAFAGSNVGNGLGWLVVVFCAALSSGALVLSWLVMDRLTNWIKAITVDRDLASGLRAGAFFLAGGLIAGRAVAGHWVSVAGTFKDFWHNAWGLLPLMAVACGGQLWLRPTPRNPSGSIRGAVLCAAIFLGVAIVFVYSRGPMP